MSILLVMTGSILTAAAQNVTMTSYETAFGQATVGSEPRGRGTVGIIFSCSTTLFFCVWTSVHTNIMRGATPWYRLYYKFIYMLVSLIVPEGIIICAFGQWRAANRLRRAWRQKLGLEPITWLNTLMFWRTSEDGLGSDGAFFVVMGGFVVDLPIPAVTDDKLPITAKPATATLTPHGFLKYLDEGYIHRETFDKRSIVDKGKTSNIAKLVASTQTLWLLVQCVSRWVTSLPLTLLEIHVVIQVLCTIILYTLWWSKPLDVNDPIKISLEKAPADKSRDTPNYGQWELVLEEEKDENYFSESELGKRNFFILSTPACLTAVVGKAYHDMMEYIVHSNYHESQSQESGWLPLFVEGMLITTIGVLHAAAWNVHFPSDVELWLWRGSSIAMCVFPFGPGIIVSKTNYQHDLVVLLWKMQFEKKGFVNWIMQTLRAVHGICVKHGEAGGSIRYVYLHYMLILVCLFFVSCYAFSVMFITVEAYISLRSPPDGSFLTPKWTDYWPHL